MVITNFTGDISQKTIEERFCSAEFTTGLHNHFICLSVLNIFLSIIAFLGNTLILVALYNDTTLHPPSKLLYRNLAITDLCVGIIAEPLAVLYWMSVVNARWNICRHAYLALLIVGYILCPLSLLTLTAISVDRLLALLLGLRYRQVVTVKRTHHTIIAFWATSIVATTVHFWSSVIVLWCSYLLMSLCLITSVFSYTKIYLTLRHQQIQVLVRVHQEPPIQAVPLNIARYKKAVSSALWVQLTLLVSYLPRGVLDILVIHKGLSSSFVFPRQLTVTFIFLNSSLNPLLYCWKIREVRQAVKETIRQLSCSSS